MIPRTHCQATALGVCEASQLHCAPTAMHYPADICRHRVSQYTLSRQLGIQPNKCRNALYDEVERSKQAGVRWEACALSLTALMNCSTTVTLQNSPLQACKSSPLTSSFLSLSHPLPRPCIVCTLMPTHPATRLFIHAYTALINQQGVSLMHVRPLMRTQMPKNFARSHTQHSCVTALKTTHMPET